MATSPWLSSFDAIEEEIDRERIALLYRRTPVALLAVGVNSALLTWFLWGTLPARGLAIWVGGLWLLSAARLASVGWYRWRALSRPPPFWEHVHATGALLNGVGWGLGTVAFLQADLVYAVAALFVAGGMISGAALSSSTSMRSFLAYTIPAGVPAVLALCVSSDPARFVMGVTSAMYCVAMSQLAAQGGRVVLDALRLRLQNDALGRELGRRTKDRALRLQSLLDYAGVTTIVVEPRTSRVLDASRNVDGLGVPHDRLVGHRLVGGSEPWCATRSAWRDFVAAARTPGGFDEIVDHGDPPRQLAVTGTVRAVGGQDYVLVVVRDVTEQRALEADLVDAQRLASMGRVSREMAHRVNNPLSYVITSIDEALAQVRLLDGPIAARVDRSLLEAQEGAARIQATVATHLGTLGTWPPPEPIPIAPRIPVRRRVLVVDDEPRVARSMARALHRHDVVCESDPQHALEKILAAADLDVVVCDVMMPGMTGMELYREVQRHAPQVARRFVFVTAGAFTDEADQFLAEVPNRCLAKPVSSEHLEDAVQAAAAL